MKILKKSINFLFFTILLFIILSGCTGSKNDISGSFIFNNETGSYL